MKGAIEAAIKEVEDAARGRQGHHHRQDRGPAQAAQKLGEKMYAQQQAETGAAGRPRQLSPGQKDEGDVVDAEFTEVKDKKG